MLRSGKLFGTLWSVPIERECVSQCSPRAECTPADGWFTVDVDESVAVSADAFRCPVCSDDAIPTVGCDQCSVSLAFTAHS